MDFEEELNHLIRARYYLIIVDTSEELRALKLLTNVCEKLQTAAVGWDVADGFSSLTSGEYEKEIKCRKGDPLDALNQIAECSKKSYLS